MTSDDASLKLTKLLDQFLVLVELLESISVHTGNTSYLGLVTVRSIAKYTHLELGTRNVPQPV